VLADNKENVFRQFPTAPSFFNIFTCIDDFDWGNTCYTNCLVDNAEWLVDYGLTNVYIDRVIVRDGDFTQFDMRGWTGSYLSAVTIENSYNVILSGMTGMEAVIFTRASTGGSAGISSFASTDSNSFLFGVEVGDGGIGVGADVEFYMEASSVTDFGNIDANNCSGDISITASSFTNFSQTTFDSEVHCEIDGTRVLGDLFASVSPFANLYISAMTNFAFVDNCVIEGSILNINTSAKNVHVRNSNFTAGSITTAVDGGNLDRVSNNIGTIVTNGFNLASVYVNGNVTANCTANNTGTARDYFNNSIV